jgi:hypothetical protein
MLKAYPVVGKKKSEMICAAFIAGAPKDAEGAVFYGVNESNAAEWLRVQRAGIPYWYCDNAYFDATRGRHFRVTKNRVQINARDLDSDGQRFNALGLEIKPWQINHDGHWLLIEQSPSFMDTVAREPRWLRDYARDLRDMDKRTIVVRGWNRDKAVATLTLGAAMSGAWCMVTHTSAAAVQATLSGINVIVSDMHALAGMECSIDPAKDQRRRFLSVLADYEFAIAELQDGTAWRKLNP